MKIRIAVALAAMAFSTMARAENLDDIQSFAEENMKIGDVVFVRNMLIKRTGEHGVSIINVDAVFKLDLGACHLDK